MPVPAAASNPYNRNPANLSGLWDWLRQGCIAADSTGDTGGYAYSTLRVIRNAHAEPEGSMWVTMTASRRN